MFHQNRDRKEDQRFQQLLWRGDDSSQSIYVLANYIAKLDYYIIPNMYSEHLTLKFHKDFAYL